MFKGNMSKMLRQAQEMQKRMETVQNELGEIVLDADSGGGMVNVKINGNLELQELNIKDEVFEEEKEMIEDLVISAVNKGIAMAQAKSKEKMDSVTGGMLSGLNIPGM
jgi:hypothetical protein|tara:strand:- start:450 stop:773 length:324 start_codon:yes stop_codon:yes gene_type:complete